MQEITVTEDSGTEYTYTVTASYSAQDGYTITYQGILFEGDSRFEHMFQLDFQKEIMKNEKNVFIKMTATPDESIRDEVDELSGILGVTMMRMLKVRLADQMITTMSFTQIPRFLVT